MDRIFYFLLVLLVVGYFFIPKICGFGYPRVFWQYELEKYRYLLKDARSQGLPLVFNGKIPILPNDVSAFYQNAILNQLQPLENIEFK